MRGVDPSKFFYWREDVAYKFTEAEIERIWEATNHAHIIAIEAATDLIKRGNLERMGIPTAVIPLIEASWNRHDPMVYGRFDMTLDHTGQPKVLEYNADTPTSLPESSLAQWFWKEEVREHADQFNSIHERLVQRWTDVRGGSAQLIHMMCSSDSMEDLGNLQYMTETALLAGFETKFVCVGDIGVTADGQFVDADDVPIQAMFKLYPWEWIAASEYGGNIATSKTAYFEPIWKMVLSNKAILAEMWERYPGHPVLLPTYYDEGSKIDGNYVKKPYLSREGANVAILDARGVPIAQTGGEYDTTKVICQQYCPLQSFPAPETTGHLGPQEKVYPVIGSWVVGTNSMDGDVSAGIDIREDVSPITKDTSYFVPHFFI